MFPLYPLDDDSWVYYCDGMEGTAGVCTYREATALSGLYNWPYAVCPDDCEPDQVYYGPNRRRHFRGYPEPFLTKASDTHHFAHPRMQRLGFEAKLIHDTEKYLRVSLEPMTGGGAPVPTYFIVFRVTVPPRFAHAQGYRYIGLEVQLGADGEPDESLIKYDVTAADALQVASQPALVTVKAITGRPSILLIRKRT